MLQANHYRKDQFIAANEMDLSREVLNVLQVKNEAQAPLLLLA